MKVLKVGPLISLSFIHGKIRCTIILLNFLVTVKAAPHVCVISTGLF